MTTHERFLQSTDSAAISTRLDELVDLISELGNNPEASDAQLATLDSLLDQQRQLSQLYLHSVPVRSISRDPFTSLEVFRAIDPSLAGRWWDHRDPIRTPRNDPATLYALTGALALDGTLDHTEHLVAPGPAVPHVVPRLLEPVDTVAVLSSVSVGAHRAYITAYYTAPPAGTRDLPVANEWPYDRWVGPNGWREVYSDEQIDTDIGSWLDRERLLWIAPDDERAILRDGTDDCPYLGLTGTNQPQRIQAGVTW